MNFGSLKAKLILLNASIVGFMSAGAVYLLYTAAKDEEHLLREKISSDVSGLSEDIQDQFYERYGDVKAFAAALATTGTGNLDIKRGLLNSYVALYGIYDIILLTDADGKFVAANDLDIAGKPIDIKPLSAMNFAGSPWFESAKKGEFLEDKEKGFLGVAVEQPHFDPLLESVYGKPSYATSFTSPVVTASGKLLGYVTTRAGFRWVEDLIKRDYLTRKAEGYESAGYSIYGSDGKVFLDFMPAQNNFSTDFSRDKAKMAELSLASMPELTQSGLAPGKSGVSSYSEKGSGDQRTVAFQPVNGPKIVNGYWNVSAHFDDREVFAARDRLVKMFVGLLSLSSLGALALGLLFGTRLSRSLQDLVTRLYRQGASVRDASGQVSETSEKLSSAAAQQAAALQETVAAVNEISAMVGRTADMATQSRNTSQNSRNVANEGKSTVDEMLDSMTLIKESNRDILSQVEEGNKEISQIVKVISEIGNKTKVINDIVFQTKLLSFNASVEAARAGEHGKGFAVVAEEVGNLAQMSGSAAKEISDLLEQSVVKVQSIVDQTGQRVEKLIVDAREKVALGEETAKRCASMLGQILSNADEVNSLITEIATSAQEQARGVQEINSAMTELDNVTQQNSSSATQSSVLSGALMVQSEDLSELVASLNMLVSGARSGSTEEGHEHGTEEEAADGAKGLRHRSANRNGQSRSSLKGRLSDSERPSAATQSHGDRGRSSDASDSANGENVRYMKNQSLLPSSVSKVRIAGLGSASGSGRAPRTAGSAALQSDEVPQADDPRFED
jgi:methyl-accepting chemotaxis protein